MRGILSADKDTLRTRGEIFNYRDNLTFIIIMQCFSCIRPLPIYLSDGATVQFPHALNYCT